MVSLVSNDYKTSENDDKPLNWILVAVKNNGSFQANNVKLKLWFNSPGGIGNPANWVPVPDYAPVTPTATTVTVKDGILETGKNIAPGETIVFSVPWSPGAEIDQTINGSTCISAELHSWEVPGLGQVFDLRPEDNGAQENIHKIQMTTNSPWHDVPFAVDVYNSYSRSMDVTLEPRGLMPGYHVTVDEPLLNLPGQTSHRFTGTLHWDPEVIPVPTTQDSQDPFWEACNESALTPEQMTAPHCGTTWSLTAFGWLPGADSPVTIGGVSYETKSRPVSTLEPVVTVDATGTINISGTIDPPNIDQRVRIIIRYPSGKVDIISASTRPDGTFSRPPITPTEPGPISVCVEIPQGGPLAAVPCEEPIWIGNYERWDGVTGTAVSQIPLNEAPDFVTNLATLEAPTNVGSNFGARITGLIKPPTTGNYTFFISGDDNVALFLSPDSSPVTKTRIAYHNGFTGVREWTKFSTQRSAPVALQAGTLYYIEAQMKEGTGSDHMAVGWLKPGQSGTPTEIVPIDRAAPTVPRGEGFAFYEKWVDVNGVAVSQIPVNEAPDFIEEVTQLEGLTNIRDNYGARIRAWLTAPATGTYKFWISGDDNVALYLSLEGGPENKTRIAYHTSYSAQYEWNKFASQKSMPISLVAGRKYYIEALMKEASGLDHFAVGWQMPGQTGTTPSEVIPGRQLSPYEDPVNEQPCASAALERVAATASSTENTNHTAAKAIDGNSSTRWSSAFSNPQWLRVDLGSVQFIERVKLSWEAAASADYDIQVSNDGTSWTTIYTDSHANGGTDDISGLAATGRYVRMYSRARTTQYGNSLWEMQVFGDANEECNPVLGARFEGEESAARSSEGGGCSVGRQPGNGSAGLWLLAAMSALAVSRQRRRARQGAMRLT